MLAGEVRDDGGGSPGSHGCGGAVASDLRPSSSGCPCRCPARCAVCLGASYEATGVPRHLLLVLLVGVLASLAMRMRVWSAACAPRRQAGRNPHLLDHPHAPLATSDRARGVEGWVGSRKEEPKGGRKIVVWEVPRDTGSLVGCPRARRAPRRTPAWAP